MTEPRTFTEASHDRLDPAQLDARAASIASILAAEAAAPVACAELRRTLPWMGEDAGPIIVLVEDEGSGADGAGDLQPVELRPGKRFVELVAALASEAQAEIRWRHGWPVLSVGGRNPAVTEGEGAGNALPGGAA